VISRKSVIPVSSVSETAVSYVSSAVRVRGTPDVVTYLWRLTSNRFIVSTICDPVFLYLGPPFLLYMEDVVIRPGMQVRYPRTGTAGTVVRIEEIRGIEFAEIDTTGLLYRTDQLIPIEGEIIELKKVRKSSDITDYEHLREIESTEDIQDAYDQVSGVGAG